jgi:hypothetical protein
MNMVADKLSLVLFIMARRSLLCVLKLGRIPMEPCGYLVAMEEQIQSR